MQVDNAMYTVTGFVDSENRDRPILPGEWRNQTAEHDVGTGCIRNIRPMRVSRYREDCLKMRNDLKVHLNFGEGSVPWQLDYVRRTYKN